MAWVISSIKLKINMNEEVRVAKINIDGGATTGMVWVASLEIDDLKTKELTSYHAIRATIDLDTKLVRDMTIGLIWPTNEVINENVMIIGQTIKIIEGKSDNLEDTKIIGIIII